MKVISLLQPWATLVVIGAKKIETRSWNTKYRGPLLIHASKGFVQLETWFYNVCIDVLSVPPYSLTKGAIIGKIDLVDTFLMNDEYIDFMKNSNSDNKQELEFGNYSPGRYGWLLSNPILFDKPIPAKGQLGLWNYDLNIPTNE